MSAKQPPWARVTGLLAGCLATLIGIWNRIDPEEILMRAVIAAIVIALVTKFACLLIPTGKRPSTR